MSLITQYYTVVPKSLHDYLEKNQNRMTRAQRESACWHKASFPHKVFVELLPQREVLGWYGAEFDVPQHLKNMDFALDLGIIDDTDETFLNGNLIGGVGSLGVSHGSAWQTDRLYRMPRQILKAHRNFIAVHVWSLWGLGGIVGPPVIKAIIPQADSKWEVAFIDDNTLLKKNINDILAAEDVLSLLSDGKVISWRQSNIPWIGYRSWKEDSHYALFRMDFKLLNDDGTPRNFPDSVVMDLGQVFDVASFYLNGKRIGLLGRFPNCDHPSFTEAAQRGQFIVKPDDWSKGGNNTLLAVVYRERGVGGITGIPGFLLENQNKTISSLNELQCLFNVYLQSGLYSDAAKLLEKYRPSSETERAWLLSNRSHLSFLKWIDSGSKGIEHIDEILSPVSTIFRETPNDSPKQPAMQALCHILRLAEKDKKILERVNNYFPDFSNGCQYAKPDRISKGDWQMFYGNRFYVLSSMGQVRDWTGPGNVQAVAYSVKIPGERDKARHWLPAAQRFVDSPSALLMHGRYKQELAACNDPASMRNFFPLLPKSKIRRVSWWDDHGEMHPFDDEGPDLNISLNLSDEESYLSLYFCDFDWRLSRHPRQQSVIVFSNTGSFLNAAWSGKIDDGIYERFKLSRRGVPLFLE